MPPGRRMSWKKPDDLEVAAECETWPEAEVLKGLLLGEGIECLAVSSADSTMLFSQRSIFGRSVDPRPIKILVRPQDKERALMLLSAEAEENDL